MAAEEAMGTAGPCNCNGVKESTAERSKVGGGEFSGRAGQGAKQTFPFGAVHVVQHKLQLTLRCIS